VPQIEKQKEKQPTAQEFQVKLNRWGDIHLRKEVREAFPFKVGEPLVLRISGRKVVIEKAD